MGVGLHVQITVTVTLVVGAGLLLVWSAGQSADDRTGHQNGHRTVGQLGHRPSGQVADCPCEEARFCERIKDTTRKEIFVFSLNPKDRDWRYYDWVKVTTVVMVGYVDLELMCLAHKYGARVVTIGSPDISIFLDPQARTSWIQSQLDVVNRNYLDGFNFDYENPIPQNNKTLRDAYTSIIADTRAAFKAALPTSMVTVDVAWSPDCIDGRCYDYLGISRVSDFLFVMAYDEQSQILGKCIAKANSPYNRSTSGLQRYLDIGVPSDKLVLGIPWYGYYYPCLSLSQTDECSIREVPFRGVNCSDAAGREIDYKVIIEMLKASTGGRKFDKEAESPYFNYKDPETNTMHQIRYDDPQSLKVKFMMAIDKDLRGVGVWNAESVNYTSTDWDQIEAVKDMWDTFPSY